MFGSCNEDIFLKYNQKNENKFEERIKTKWWWLQVIIKKDEVEHTMTENRVLQSTRHPFLIVGFSLSPPLQL